MTRISSLTSKFLTVIGGGAGVPSYDVTPSTNSVNEGSAVTFNVTTTNIANGSTLYWSNEGTTVASDFQENVNSGSFTIENGAGSVTLTLSNDLTTEGGETIDFKVRTDSVSGTIVASASTVTVSDTSTTPSPTYGVSPATSSVDEGSSLTFNVTTSNVANDTTLYWTINHTTSSSADFSATSGSFTITSNAGSFSVTTIADVTTEDSETFTMEIRTGSTSGTVVATSTSVTINDTSTAPALSVIYMVVGSGGGAGSNYGGGGGAGSIRTNINSPFATADINPAATVFPYTPGQSYTIGIGGGGTGFAHPSPTGYNPATNGSNCSITGPFGTFTGNGGGGGGYYRNPMTPAYGAGLTGGCGGGGNYYVNNSGGTNINPALVVSSGFAGGNTPSAPIAARGGMGGGGILGTGGIPPASPATPKGGDGGPGANWMSWYACGGGGGGSSSPLTTTTSSGGYGGGGFGQGGAPAPTGRTGGSGTAGTGGGGGGGNGLTISPPGASYGGAGGSGVAIIGYPGPQIASGGTVSSNGGYTWHTFTGSGTFTWN